MVATFVEDKAVEVEVGGLVEHCGLFAVHFWHASHGELLFIFLVVADTVSCQSKTIIHARVLLE